MLIYRMESTSSTATVEHKAPAGSSYECIEDAGHALLSNYCDTNKNFIIPGLYKSKYPENVPQAESSGNNSEVRQTKKERKLKGIIKWKTIQIYQTYAYFL